MAASTTAAQQQQQESKGGSNPSLILQQQQQLDSSRAERALWLLKLPPRVSNAWALQAASASSGARQQQQNPINNSSIYMSGNVTNNSLNVVACATDLHVHGLSAGAALGSSSTASTTTGSCCLGKLVLTLDPTKSEGENRSFSLELIEKETNGIMPQRKVYLLDSTKDPVPMYAFSETSPGRIAVEGKVEHKFDTKPNTFASDEYRKLCRERTDKSRMKTRTVQMLENDHGGYIRPHPVAIGPTYVAKKKAAAAKATDMKRTRIERTVLEDLLFKHFEEQAHWTLKQLVSKTEQPEAFLKEVMVDLCNYNKRGPNQGKYELKPEYRSKPTDENPGTT